MDKEVYEKKLERSRQWYLDNPERTLENNRNWRLKNPDRVRGFTRNWKLRNPDKVREHTRKHQEDRFRKGGKLYLKTLNYEHTGLRAERSGIRAKHRSKWRAYKKIIAPESQIHHAWQPGTAKYDGVALVEKNAHQHGIIDVIEILDGKITILLEEDYVK